MADPFFEAKAGGSPALPQDPNTWVTIKSWLARLKEGMAPLPDGLDITQRHSKDINLGSPAPASASVPPLRPATSPTGFGGGPTPSFGKRRHTADLELGKIPQPPVPRPGAVPRPSLLPNRPDLRDFDTPTVPAPGPAGPSSPSPSLSYLQGSGVSPTTEAGRSGGARGGVSDLTARVFPGAAKSAAPDVEPRPSPGRGALLTTPRPAVRRAPNYSMDRLRSKLPSEAPLDLGALGAETDPEVTAASAFQPPPDASLNEAGGRDLGFSGTSMTPNDALPFTPRQRKNVLQKLFGL